MTAPQSEMSHSQLPVEKGVSLNDLLEGFAEAARNTSDKGAAFERLVAGYLRSAPEYKDRFTEVHLLQDWPERRAQHDHGIDLVAWDTDPDGWCAVQCKFYARDHRIQKADIDGFLAASGRRGFTSRLYVSTTDHWGSTAERANCVARLRFLGNKASVAVVTGRING